MFELSLLWRYSPSPHNLGQREAKRFQRKEIAVAKYPDVNAGQTEACINRMGGWENFLRFIGGSGKVVFDSILTFIREVMLGAQPALTHVATSKEYWENAGVVWANEHFKVQFGDDLALDDAAASVYVIRRLEQGSLDAPIIAELGGEESAESPVAHFHAFLAENRKSTEYFIFYLRGKDGNLWAVRAAWSAGHGGWYVDAFSVSHPGEWDAGHRVVSRK